MSYEYSEDGLVETATQHVLEELGWKVVYAWTKETFGAGGLLGRETKSEIILRKYLLAALKKYNAGLPEIAYTQAIEQIEQKVADKTLGRINKEKYLLLTDGVSVSFTNENGELEKEKLRVFDFDDYNNNDFLAVRQFEICGELYNRRPDVIGFVNGIPLVFFELKAHHNDLRNAYEDNLKDYKDTITQTFHCNAFIILSNGTDAKVGTVTSPYKFFLDWKRFEEDEEGVVSLDTMLRGTCAKEKLMDIFENFLLYDDSGGDVVKLMAKNHQYIGVNKVLEQVETIEDLKGKLGVFWHTQGSGKSYSMVFICQKIHRRFGGSYTFLIVADRSELETQLYDTFTGVGAVTDKNVIAGSKKDSTGREHLRELLSENHKYVFTLIHKFSIDPKTENEYPLITDRKNIIVISDEAHRTQGGTFARNMRFNGIPNASYLGFTGTPIIKEEEELTKNIFGEYVSVYDFKRAIDDGATLPLRYLNRGEKLGIENPALNEQMAEILEDETIDDDKKRKLTYLFQRDYVILTAEKRLDAIAKDLVWHFNERGYQGKAMFVALDKPTAVRIFDLITKHWQPYISDLKKLIEKSTDEQESLQLTRKLQKVESTEICVVVSSEQNEVDKFRKLGLDIETHRKKMNDPTRDLEKDFKNEKHPFRLSIVCAMWITGFDVPCVSTIYLDKPIKGHTLMQTIARANRVYDDEKENGLIVDYGNVYKQLEKAYSVYGEGGRTGGGSGQGGEVGTKKPVELLIQLAEELNESIKALKGYLKELGFNLNELTNADAKPMDKLGNIKKATDCICLNETTRTKFEIMAREVFKKYHALYPEEQVKPFLRQFNAIEAIYNQLNQKVREADVSDIISQLQQVVNESISINPNKVGEPNGVYIDLANLDLDKLRAAFLKTQRKNTLVFDLQQAVEKKLEQMMKENPLRLEFYDRYKEIIDEYNRGKSLEDTVIAFEKLSAFTQGLTVEDSRAIRENLTEETLAIYDLLREGKELTQVDMKQVKKVAVDTLEKLKEEKLKIERWRESRQISSQVKQMINDYFLNLPMQVYTDEDVNTKSISVFQHIYSNYPGGNQSAYTRATA
jgi:type I restriction enzyme R subunit